MKQLFMMNDMVKHPKAIPRILNVVASTSSACRRSEGISTGYCEGAGIPTFAKDDRITSCPSLLADEETEERVRKMPHDKYPVHGINTSCQKPRMFVDVFEIVLFSSVPR